MRFPVDLSLFEGTAHSPSFLSLERSMRRRDLLLRDFCIPVNPYFPTDRMFANFRANLATYLKYYPAQNEALAEILAGFLSLDPDTIVVANGSTELITWADRLFVRDTLATPVPTFGRWTDQPSETGKRVASFVTTADEDFDLDVDRFAAFVRSRAAPVAAICNPNNPTGALLARSEVLRLLDLLEDLDLILIDESFIDFAEPDASSSVADVAARRSNVMVLKSLGKNFGLHGLRLGYAVACPAIAGQLRSALPHWNVNGVAEMVLREVVQSPAEYDGSRRRVIVDRQDLEEELRTIPELRVFPSRANFVYVRVTDEVDGAVLRDHLLTEHGCFVRQCGNKLGSDRQFFRIAARPASELQFLGSVLRQSLAELRRADTNARLMDSIPRPAPFAARRDSSRVTAGSGDQAALYHNLATPG